MNECTYEGGEHERTKRLTPGGVGDVAGSSLDGVVARQELGTSEDSTSARDALGSTNTALGNGLAVGTENQLGRGLAEALEAENGQVLVVQVLVIDHDVVGLNETTKTKKESRQREVHMDVRNQYRWSLFLHSSWINLANTCPTDPVRVG